METTNTRKTRSGRWALIGGVGLISLGLLGFNAFAAFTGAVDARALGADTLRQVRAAYAYSHAPGRSREHFVWLTGRLGPAEGRVGVARTFVATHATTRPRLAIGVHHARYLVAIAREESPFGLSPVYHFTLVTTFARDR